MSEEKLDLILKEIQLIKSEQQEMRKEQQEMRKEQQEMKKEQQGMKSELEEIKAQLEENTQITKAIHHRQEETDAKLEGLSLDFAKLHGEVVSTKTSMNELAEDQKSIKELLGEHEISIRSLRRQSV